MPACAFRSSETAAVVSGRAMELFGEDTYHMAHMAMQYTIGLQTDPQGSKYVKIAACTKHYAVHDGPGMWALGRTAISLQGSEEF